MSSTSSGENIDMANTLLSLSRSTTIDSTLSIPNSATTVCNSLDSPHFEYLLKNSSDMAKTKSDPIPGINVLLTPPNTQELENKDDFNSATDNEALVDESQVIAQEELFTGVKWKHVPFAPRPTQLPGKFNAPFDAHLFSDLIKDMDDNKVGLFEYRGFGIKVVVHDQLYQRKPEHITFDELYKRAKQWIRLRIPNLENLQSVSREIAYVPLGGCCESQQNARRLALHGMLGSITRNHEATADSINYKWRADGPMLRGATAKRYPISYGIPGSVPPTKRIDTAESPKQAPKKTRTGGKGRQNANRERANKPQLRRGSSSSSNSDRACSSTRISRPVRAQLAPAKASASNITSDQYRVTRPSARATNGRARRPSTKAAEGQKAQAAEAVRADPETATKTKIQRSKTKARPIAPAAESDSSAAESSGTQSSASSNRRTKIKLNVSPTGSLVASVQASPEPAPVTESLQAVEPATQPITSPHATSGPSKKRKRDGADNSNPAPKKEPKRAAFDFNNNSEGTPGRFGNTVKECLRARSDDKYDYAAFDDGRVLCTEDGPGTPHYDQEMVWAQSMKLSEAEYKIVKYKFFLGVAMLTEQNNRTEKQAIANNKKFVPLNFNKTMAQMFNSIDVSKSSALYTLYKGFGWIPEMILVDGNKKKSINPVYNNLSSAETRNALLAELKAFELLRTHVIPNRVVMPSQG